MTVLHLKITGMACGKCEKHEIAGVTKVKIDKPSEKLMSGIEILAFFSHAIRQAC